MSDHRLPPGFRFFPTDEELVVHFLHCKASRRPCLQPDIIPSLDLRLFDPWQLNGKALQGGDQWYFFSHAAGNKASPSGYWMPVGVKETITSGNKDVGIKTTLVFYVGEAPQGVKTNWVMHEYQLVPNNISKGSSSGKIRGNKRSDLNLVVCRVHEASFFDLEETELSCLDEVFLSLDDLDEISMPL